MDQHEIAQCVNVLGAFCGVRDVPALTRAQLRGAIGQEQADVMALFGGSILAGTEVLAGAMREGAAKKYVIVGGAGHTTQSLRDEIHRREPSIETAGRPEAEIFAAYLARRYGMRPDALECESTNCGNNITNLLALLEGKNIGMQSIILCQDATMQRRMEAGLRKYRPDVRIVNFASYQATVRASDGGLEYAEEIDGMWDVERYMTLLMGEIPRLSDDEGGYGPKGRGFIAHVDVPQPVQEAFEQLRTAFSDRVRAADARFATDAQNSLAKKA